MFKKPEIDGYCPVAYFLADKPLKGDSKFSSVYQGKKYLFVSADAQKEFESNPDKYIPAFGGACAYGMSVGEKFPVDPTNFKIVDGNLLLFLKNDETDAKDLWENSNQTESLKKAKANFSDR